MKWMAKVFLLFAVCLLSCVDLVLSVEPAERIDLSRWKLTLPVGANDEFSGHPSEIFPRQLVEGYSHSDYFRIQSDGAMAFWVPVCGARTDNSDYPRCELREMLDPDDESINWSLQGTHALQARCRVVQLPSSKKVILGQIHGFKGKALPLVKLQYFKDRVEALVKRSPNKGGDHKIVLAKVDLNSDITYEIRLENGTLTLSVDGRSQQVDILGSDPAWAEQTFYFKAGAYCQDNDGPPTEGARVTFSRLHVVHSHNR